jgi:iron complex outermembrane recepter protein
MKDLPIIFRSRCPVKAGILFPVPGKSSRFLLIAIFSVLPMLLFQAARAESPAEPGKPLIHLPGSEEVIVTASRIEEKVAFVPSGVTVLTDQDIRNSPAENIPELLSTTPGITVTDLTGGKRNYRIDIRGFGETSGANTLVLINGRRVNQPDLSGVDWSQISLTQVKRIEIVRGGRGGVLFGDNASSGVINIITADSQATRGRIGLTGGSYNSLGLNADYSGRTETLGYSLSGGIYDSEGYRDNSSTSGRDAGGSLRYSPNKWFQVSLHSGFHHDETGMPGALTETDLAGGNSKSGTVYPNDRFRVSDYHFQAKPTFLFLKNSRFETDISFRKRDNKFFSSAFWGNYQGNTKLETLVLSPRLVIGESLGKMKNRFIAGLDLTRNKEDILNTSSYAPQAAFTLEKNNLGVFLHDEMFVTENLAISGGYRYDRVEYGFGSVVTEKPEFSESLATAGISWQFMNSSNLYFEYGSGLRYPLLDEMFDFFSNSINSGLSPQTSESCQAGVNLFFSNRFFVNSALYRIRTRDEIFFNPRGGGWGFGANENFAGSNNRKGLEIGSGLQLDRLTLSGSLTFTGSEVEDGVYSGSNVPGVPSRSFSVKGIYFLNDNLDLTLEGIYAGKRYFESDWANTFPKQEDYFLLNSRIQYKKDGVLLHLDLKNILNQEYSQYGVLGGSPTQRAYYPSPKFNVMAGITFEY